MNQKSAIAIGAHPDDIEFYMAGTLLMLKRAGYEIHYLTVANGNCGSVEYSRAQAKKIRNAEAREGARILGATFHDSLCSDLEIVYSVELLRKVASVIRAVRPTIVLTHSPQDYMEDHMATCRLAVTAAFTRGMPNFETVPSRKPADGEVTIYHAMPHGLCDGLRRGIIPGSFVNTAPVQQQKFEALSAHKSQQSWLDVSQKLNSFLQALEDSSSELGRMSKKFKYAEGWRRHLHLGFCGADADPLARDLGADHIVNKAYEAALKKGI